jgi:hypothetical protein
MTQPILPSTPSSATPSNEVRDGQHSPNARPLPIVVTAGSCAIAIGLATVSHFLGRTDYDPTLAITTLAVIGAAVLAYFARETLLAQWEALDYTRKHDREVREAADIQQAQDLSRRRANLATAVLAELAFLTARLRNAFEHGPESYHDPFAHPMLTEALTHTEILDPVTTQDLAAVAVELRDVQLLMETRREARRAELEFLSRVDIESVRARYGNDGPALTAIRDVTKSLDFPIRARAGWAYNRIPDLVNALRDLERGQMPPVDPNLPATPDSLPQLRPDPFPRLPKV